MTRTLPALIRRLMQPDELDMAEHYETRGERLADLWVHLVGLGLAGIGGIVLAVPRLVNEGGLEPPASGYTEEITDAVWRAIGN